MFFEYAIAVTVYSWRNGLAGNVLMKLNKASLRSRPEQSPHGMDPAAYCGSCAPHLGRFCHRVAAIQGLRLHPRRGGLLDQTDTADSMHNHDHSRRSGGTATDSQKRLCPTEGPQSASRFLKNLCPCLKAGRRLSTAFPTPRPADRLKGQMRCPSNALRAYTCHLFAGRGPLPSRIRGQPPAIGYHHVVALRR